MKRKILFLAILLIIYSSLGASAVVLNSSEGVNVNVTLNNQIAQFNSTGLDLADNDLYYFENQCTTNQAVTGIHPNGTLKCKEIGSAFETENLSETLQSGNVANQSIDMSTNDIQNPGLVDGVDLDSPGNGIEIDGSDQFGIITDSLNDNEIVDDSLTNNSLDSSGSFSLNQLELTSDLTGTGVVNSGQLASSSVIESKIGTGAVTDNKIIANSINRTQIESSEITRNQLNTEVTGAGLKGGGGSRLSSDTDKTLAIIDKGILDTLYGTYSEWNSGSFDYTSADVNDLGDEISLGYMNSTDAGQSNGNGIDTDDLIGYYRMDRDISGDGGTVKDYSGNNSDGTTSGGVSTNAGGVFGTKSFSFDGSSSEHVDLGNDVNFNGDSMAISGWIYPTFDGDRADGRIIDKSDGTSTSDHWYMVSTSPNDEDEVRFRLRTGGNTQKHITTSDPLQKNEWQHIAAVYDGSQVRIYVDSNLEYTDSQSGQITQDTNNPTYIGDSSNSDRHWPGRIDELMLHDKSLSDQKVQELYLSGIPFIGNHTTPIRDTGSSRSWKDLYVDAEVPSETSATVEFRSIDTNDNQVDSQEISLSSGARNYSLSVSDSQKYELFFNGSSSNPAKSWKINDYRAIYEDNVNQEDKPLGIAEGGVGTAQLEAESVTGNEIDGPLNMEGETVRNLPSPPTDASAATKNYVDEKAGSASSTATQTLQEVLDEGNIANRSINMDGYSINNIDTLTANQTQITVSDDISMSGSTIKKIPSPNTGGDAVNKTYVDDAVNGASQSSTQTLAEVLDEGNDANQNIDMQGNSVSSSSGEICIGDNC